MFINKSKYLFVVTLHLLKCLLSDRGKPRRTEMLTEIAQKDEYWLSWSHTHSVKEKKHKKSIRDLDSLEMAPWWDAYHI